MKNKFQPISQILSANMLDIFFVQESKLDNSFPLSQFHVDGFKLHRHDCTASQGGIVVYIRDDIAHRRRNDIENYCINDDRGRVEILCLEVSIRKEQWLFISVYKQPKVRNNILKCVLENVLNDIDLSKYCVTMIGDININMKNYDVDMGEILDVYGLSNIVKTPTCFKNRTSPSIIYVIFVNMPRRFNHVITFDCGLSDCHNMVCVSTKLHVPPQQKKRVHYRSYKKFNEEKFCNDLASAPFYVSEIFDDMDDSYWFFSSLLSDIITEHAPVKTKILKRTQVPYMNSNLRKTINVKNMLWRKYKKNVSTENWNRYRAHRNYVTKLRKQSMSTYLTNKCNVSNTGKEFWGAVKPLISTKSMSSNGHQMLKF